MAKIGTLDLLRYEVIVPKAVFDEIAKPEREYGKELRDWGKDRIVEVGNKRVVEYLEIILGKGEAETIDCIG